MDRLTAMRVFVSVVETGSQTRAAERLDISRAMVSRHLAELEHWLGARLLHRTTRRLSLTDAGEECLARSRQVLEQIDALEDNTSLRHAGPRGLVRVTAAMSFGQQVLAPAVAAYLARYPQVRVDLLLLDRTVNLVEERIDLAIRISNDLDPALIARRLADCHSVICAAPAYLARCGAPASLSALAGHNCLTYACFGHSQWRCLHHGQPDSVEVSGNLSANEAATLLHAARAGTGVALLPSYLADPWLHNGELIALLPDWRPLTMGIYGVYASRRHPPAAVRALLDFLAEWMAEWAGEGGG